MILDEFGKPARGNTFCVPDWLRDESARLARDWEADRRLRELRNSLAFAAAADRPFIVGDTITVKLPARYARLQSPKLISDTECTE